MPTDLPLDTADPSSGIPGIMVAAFILFGLFFVGILLLGIVSATRRYRVAKESGLDPFAGDIQVMGKVAHAAALAPERSVEERLAEVDALAKTGSITTEEHQTARARILGTL
jgi:hypothetical protein